MKGFLQTLVVALAMLPAAAVAQCTGYSGPGGACYSGPGGGLYSGPGGGAYSGPGGGLYTGPGGGLYTGPGVACIPDQAEVSTLVLEAVCTQAPEAADTLGPPATMDIRGHGVLASQASRVPIGAHKIAPASHWRLCFTRHC
jgi:hypothetical protein